jgi:HdeA/HdeB family
MKAGLIIARSVIIVSAILGSTFAAAQAANTRTIDQYSCKDVMREHGDNRDVTIAFLHGFLLGKSGGATFDIDALHKQTSDFIEYCLDNPTAKAVDAMAKVKG